MTSVWENAGSPGSVPPASHPHGGRALLEHPSPRGTCLGGCTDPQREANNQPGGHGSPHTKREDGKAAPASPTEVPH